MYYCKFIVYDSAFQQHVIVTAITNETKTYPHRNPQKCSGCEDFFLFDPLCYATTDLISTSAQSMTKIK